MRREQIDSVIRLIDEIPSGKVELDDWVRRFESALIPLCTDARLNVSDLLQTLAGFLAWKFTGHTPELAHHRFISLFCRTDGLFQELVHRLTISNSEREKELIGLTGASLSNRLFGGEITDCIRNLFDEGYAVTSAKVSAETVRALTLLASETPCILRDRFDGTVSSDAAFVDPNTPVATTAWVPEQQLSSSEALEEILNDVQLRYVVCRYLGTSRFHVRKPSLWWTFPSPDQLGKEESAQFFHFDLDAPKWLKLFIYLSDVGDHSGPHFYIPGSHKPGSKPEELLRRGYARIPDSDIMQYYSNELVSIKGSVGTAFFGDTSCWHKGSTVHSGFRLCFSVEFAASGFQTSYGI